MSPTTAPDLTLHSSLPNYLHSQRGPALSSAMLLLVLMLHPFSGVSSFFFSHIHLENSWSFFKTQIILPTDHSVLWSSVLSWNLVYKSVRVSSSFNANTVSFLIAGTASLFLCSLWQTLCLCLLILRLSQWMNKEAGYWLSKFTDWLMIQILWKNFINIISFNSQSNEVSSTIILFCRCWVSGS